jgi:predicted transcriptional regulator
MQGGQLTTVSELMAHGLSTVSEWMEHGNIMEYIKSNHVNRLELVGDFASPTTSFTQMRQ